MLDLLDDRRRIGAGQLLEDDRGRWSTVDVGVDVVIGTAEFDLRNVLEPADLTVGSRLEDDILVLIRFVVPAHPRQHVFDGLGCLSGRLPQSPWRTDHALLGDRFHHVFRAEVVGPHAVEIEPYPHRILAASEDRGAADASHPLDLGQEVHEGVVVEEVLIVSGVGAVDVHIHQHAGHRLHDDDPFALDERGQSVLHRLDPVLHVEHCNVGVRARLEDDHDRRFAGTRGCGRHISHVGHAVDRLLEDDEHGINEDLGTGARKSHRHDHARGCHGRKLRDRQRRNRKAAEEENDDRDDDRKRRSFQEVHEHEELPQFLIQEGDDDIRVHSACCFRLPAT